ncbi:thymidine phosphorylase [archaeon BMS3Abin17]|nr:thymidine phosphorylase [archaeon BMS3Abin17]HDZ61478.1 thymidine phosphorylase [Candidatus Pacearchaeota archaeon]
MELKVKLLKWSAGVPVAMLNKETADKIGVHIKDRISIKTLSDKPKEIFTIVDTIKRVVKKNEIAISSEIKKMVGLRLGQKVDVNLAFAPKSMIFIKKKLMKKRLSQKELDEIIKDVVNNALSESEISIFISAMYEQGMSIKETVYLIKSILKYGNQLKLRNKLVADKHSIGGIPGNRATPIVISICAAAGIIMPKSSSRAITSSAGTADVIETVASVDFSIKELKKIIKKTGACIVWGGALGLVPADSRIIRIEKLLKLDPEAMLLSSIMAKKLAMDADYIIIDIPYGKTAKVDKKKAINLKRKFKKLGRIFRKNVEVFIMEAKEPMGTGVGPALELIDVIQILDPKLQGPRDLENKSLFLAGKLLEMTKKAKKGKGIILAEKILFSGKAYQKFKQIIKAQNKNPKVKNIEKLLKSIKPAKFKKDILTQKSGKIEEIHNSKINSLARSTGCPVDKFSGLRIFVSAGDDVKRSDKLMTIYSESRTRLKNAVKFYNTIKPIRIS